MASKRVRTSTRDDIMTVEQVADYLQLNKLTVYKYIRTGRLAASRLGKSYRVRKADIDWFLESQKVPGARRPAAGSRRIAARQARPTEEIAVAPQRPDEVDLRDIDIGLRDPLVWMIRGLH